MTSRIPHETSKWIDLSFRRLLVFSKLFTKSWGHPDTFKQLAKYRREIMSKGLVMDLANDLRPTINISRIIEKEHVNTFEGNFKSPHAMIFPDHMPDNIGYCQFRAILPKKVGPVCVHLASTGDHSYFRREYYLAEHLLKNGVGAILIQNPFYSNRKPTDQFRSSLANVSDLFIMGSALIAESNYLIKWAAEHGYGPFSISGISLGGFMAQLAASNARHPVSCVPIMSWTTASPAYTSGAIAPSVCYNVLQKQLEDSSYTDKLKQIPDVDWLDQMHEMTAKNGDTLARNMMRVLMDYFTSLEVYPTLKNPEYAHVFLAEQDQYVVGGHGTKGYSEVWPGVTVEQIPGHGHVTAYFSQHEVWRRKINEKLRMMEHGSPRLLS